MAAPVFFKELPLIISLQGKSELVNFAAGFSKPVDALSGMTINLKDIMDWQNEWSRICSSRDFSTHFDFLEQAEIFFAARAAGFGAQAPVVQIRFHSGTVLRREGAGAWVIRSCPVRDVQNVLRICELSFVVENEADLSKAFEFSFPEMLEGDFSEASKVLPLFAAQAPLKIHRLEMMNPLSKISQVIEIK